MIRHILHGPVPEIGDRWSAQYKDFLSQCLVKDPALRANSETLLLHPWMEDADRHKEEFSALIAEFVQIKKEGFAIKTS